MSKNTQADAATQGDPLWTITQVRDTKILTTPDGVQDAKAITFELFDGTQSTVIIPESEFNPKNVQRVIHDKAVNILQVLDLSGPPVPPAQGDFTVPGS